MDNSKLYSTSRRLLQIEGPSFADNATATLVEAGIPEDKVEEVLIWAIGEDFHRIRIRDWPIRLQKNGFDIKCADLIVDGLTKIANAWKAKHDNSGNSEHRDN